MNQDDSGITRVEINVDYIKITVDKLLETLEQVKNWQSDHALDSAERNHKINHNAANIEKVTTEQKQAAEERKFTAEKVQKLNTELKPLIQVMKWSGGLGGLGFLLFIVYVILKIYGKVPF